MCRELLVFSEEGEASMVPSASATNRNSLGSVVLLIIMKKITTLKFQPWGSSAVFWHPRDWEGGHSTLLSEWPRRALGVRRDTRPSWRPDAGGRHRSRGCRVTAVVLSGKAKWAGRPAVAVLRSLLNSSLPFQWAPEVKYRWPVNGYFFHSNKYSTHQPINLKKF